MKPHGYLTLTFAQIQQHICIFYQRFKTKCTGYYRIHSNMHDRIFMSVQSGEPRLTIAFLFVS